LGLAGGLYVSFHRLRTIALSVVSALAIASGDAPTLAKCKRFAEPSFLGMITTVSTARIIKGISPRGKPERGGDGVRQRAADPGPRGEP
jgi:hypothetical protein